MFRGWRQGRALRRGRCLGFRVGGRGGHSVRRADIEGLMLRCGHRESTEEGRCREGHDWLGHYLGVKATLV